MTFLRLSGLTLLCLVMASPAYGVIVGTTDISDFSDPSSDYNEMNWDYVYQTSVGTSVAIGSWYLLTAKHYNPGGSYTFTVGSDIFQVVSRQAPPADSGQSLAPDLRIIEVRNTTNPGTPLPGFYEMHDEPLTTSSQDDVIIVGTGNTGVDHTTYYTETPSTRDKRWGTNTIAAVNQRENTSSLSTMTFRMDYYSGVGGTEYEAGFGIGDSGGGTFIKVQEWVEIEGEWTPVTKWKLAGINLYRSETYQGSTEYINASAAAIPYYEDWISAQINEALSGDADRDSDVDSDDLDLLAANWGSGNCWAEGDFNHDGLVNIIDLGILSSNWDSSVPMPSFAPGDWPSEQDPISNPVPEPASLVLLVAGALGLVRRRRA